ncbi:MAG: 16S rRNA (guanine(527)-N(7))-methyltransferase RsmG [Pseudomonadota bacterium]
MTEPQRLALERYAELLERWNTRFNLVSRKDINRLWPRHILDSLSLSPFLGHAAVAVDLGTGAGLPGVPLAIAHSTVQWHLLDRNERKIRFLELVVRELGLENVTPRVADPAVAIPVGLEGSVDLLVSRAVAAPALLTQLAAPMLKETGRLALMTGAAPPEVEVEAESTKAAGEPLQEGFQELARESVMVPGLDRTHEVTIIGRARRTTS